MTDCPCACHWHKNDGTKWHDKPCCDQPAGSKLQVPDAAQAAPEPAAWQWRYVGNSEWNTPSGGRKITPEELKRERPIEQRPLYSEQPAAYKAALENLREAWAAVESR